MTDLATWLGHSDTLTETIDPAPMQLLAATLDLPPVATDPGETLAPMWHWLYFLPNARQSDLGPDGHPRRGLFYPDVPMKRRMFAGGKVTIDQPLRVGESATQRREIISIDEKEGSTGPLVLVGVRHEIEGADGGAITEQQTIVYTDSAPTNAPLQGDPPSAVWEQSIPTDPTLLFRFSALTFNSHRIHYDRPYAVEEEGYPGLVVHGPLMLVLLAELARKHGVEAKSIRFRAKSPVFCGDTVHLRGNLEDGRATLRAYRGSQIAMEAEIE